MFKKLTAILNPLNRGGLQRLYMYVYNRIYIDIYIYILMWFIKNMYVNFQKSFKFVIYIYIICILHVYLDVYRVLIIN